jgi:hypothetical protein
VVVKDRLPEPIIGVLQIILTGKAVGRLLSAQNAVRRGGEKIVGVIVNIGTV